MYLAKILMHGHFSCVTWQTALSTCTFAQKVIWLIFSDGVLARAILMQDFYNLLSAIFGNDYGIWLINSLINQDEFQFNQNGLIDTVVCFKLLSEQNASQPDSRIRLKLSFHFHFKPFVPAVCYECHLLGWEVRLHVTVVFRNRCDEGTKGYACFDLKIAVIFLCLRQVFNGLGDSLYCPPIVCVVLLVIFGSYIGVMFEGYMLWGGRNSSTSSSHP